MSGARDLTRITANFTPRAHSSLAGLVATTGMSQTDVINKAVLVYGIVEDLLARNDGRLQVRHGDGTEETIYLV